MSCVTKGQVEPVRTADRTLRVYEIKDEDYTSDAVGSIKKLTLNFWECHTHGSPKVANRHPQCSVCHLPTHTRTHRSLCSPRC